MKGKAAVQNANRRTREAQDRIAQLEQELRDTKAAHRNEAQALRTSLSEERQNTLARAGEIAQAEVKRLRDEHAAKLRSLGISEGIEFNLMQQKDVFILNACRYVSMTRGFGPLSALPVVITWCTNEDFWGYGDDPVTWVEKLGVSPSSWTARTLRRARSLKYDEARLTRRNRRDGKPEAWSLDHAEENTDSEMIERIHPKYKPSWYPRIKGWSEATDWIDHEEPEDADVST